ncbi:uncharacterized protein A4U43_C07F31320 [Asparagus officinalis]|uniref:Uncharacterized protein n=1 Tax=Asparagus officinalis TaxID=4686 RepID=A0A5P1EGE1_ASPOF|nr:uncharacterized protein LOC109848490 isoform X2 [Asparagus officinalis]ONK64904.1 uncharacterized protein A4U43_C07F31320 [Asparagus officinalis]
MATRSPSPNLSRPRTPEISNNLRKSKEIPQRNSLSKPSTPNSSPRASFEQKENVKSRSSAISSSKVSKNFMAPTISASSKAIVPPSPRKRILQERNEVINSVSDSVEFSMKEVGIGVEFEDIVSKSEMGFGSQEVLSVGQLKKGESRIKNHQNPSPLQAIAPLDADPSLPPYDPKTNYLSPRPQFLHYRPNPRIEQYLNREGEFLDVNNGRRLEDSFSLESSEDDDVTVLTEEKEKDSEEKVEEVESVNETAVSEPGKKVGPFKRWSFKRYKLVLFLLVLAMACSYAPLPDSPIISSSISLRKIHSLSFQTFEGLQLNDYLAVDNGHFNGLVSRFKHSSTDSIAYFSSMNLPTNDDVSLHHLANMSSLAVDETEGLDLSCKPKSEIEQPIKENLVEVSYDGNEPEVSAFVKEEENDDDDGAKYNAGEVEAKDLDENTEAVSDEGKENEIGVSEDIMDADIVVYTKEDADNAEIVVSEDVKESELDAQRIEMGEVLEDIIDADIVAYTKEDADSAEIVVSEDVKESELDAQRIEMGEVLKDVIDADAVAYIQEDADNIEIVVPEDVKESELDAQGIEMGKVFEDVIDADTLNYGMEKEITEIIENTEIVSESEIIGDEQNGNDVNAVGQTKSASSLNNNVASNVDYQISHGLELLKSTNYATMFGLALALSAVPATLAALYMKQKQVPVVVKERRATKKVGSVSGSSEPCPRSEMSTSWNNISKRDEEENLSSKSRLRRDSTASSSISYGSFTTYEKLSAKKGCPDEEVVTPVRRSSRIRNLVISP